MWNVWAFRECWFDLFRVFQQGNDDINYVLGKGVNEMNGEEKNNDSINIPVSAECRERKVVHASLLKRIIVILSFFVGF